MSGYPAIAKVPASGDTAGKALPPPYRRPYQAAFPTPASGRKCPRRAGRKTKAQRCDHPGNKDEQQWPDAKITCRGDRIRLNPPPALPAQPQNTAQAAVAPISAIFSTWREALKHIWVRSTSRLKILADAIRNNAEDKVLNHSVLTGASDSLPTSIIGASPLNMRNTMLDMMTPVNTA